MILANNINLFFINSLDETYICFVHARAYAKSLYVMPFILDWNGSTGPSVPSLSKLARALSR